MMKKIFKVTLLILGAFFVGIQLIPVDRRNPPVLVDLEAPVEVKSILKRSCYDCHSNEVNWPWYSYVAPVSWLVAYDVKEGREELNFSEWNKYLGAPEMKEEIVEEVAEGEMPLPIYLAIHRGAAVSESELDRLKQWAGYTGRSHEDGDDHD